jgi:hypothetical protein
MEEVGIRVCCMPSSPTTIVIKRVWRWRLLRCYMDVDAELHYFRMRLENGRFSDLMYCKKPRSKFVWLGRTFVSCNRDKRATPIIGDFVYHKVSPMRGLHRFKVWGKLAPRFIGPFKIQEKRGEVAYQLELPPQLSDVHDVFYVSQLKKCLRVSEEQIPMEDLDAKKNISYQEYHVKILETSERITWTKRVKMY